MVSNDHLKQSPTRLALSTFSAVFHCLPLTEERSGSVRLSLRRVHILVVEIFEARSSRISRSSSTGFQCLHAPVASPGRLQKNGEYTVAGPLLTVDFNGGEKEYMMQLWPVRIP